MSSTESSDIKMLLTLLCISNDTTNSLPPDEQVHFIATFTKVKFWMQKFYL